MIKLFSLKKLAQTHESRLTLTISFNPKIKERKANWHGHSFKTSKFFEKSPASAHTNYLIIYFKERWHILLTLRVNRLPFPVRCAVRGGLPCQWVRIIRIRMLSASSFSINFKKLPFMMKKAQICLFINQTHTNRSINNQNLCKTNRHPIKPRPWKQKAHYLDK